MADLYAEAFKCQSRPDEPSPTHILTDDLCEKAGVRYEEIFTDAEAMAKMARTIKALDGDSLVRLPFSVAVEAEQFGAKLSLHPDTRLPAVSDFPFAKLDDISSLPSFDMEKGQMAAVLGAVEILSRQGETVLLEIEGIFSILSLVASSKELYKGLYRKQEKLRMLSQRVIGQLARYARRAVKRGAKIISYADATISFELVSPEIYRTLCGAVTIEAVRALRAVAPNALFHLCSATSVGLERVGLCVSEAVPVEHGLTYGAALIRALAWEENPIIGHGCPVRSAYRLESPFLYKLKIRRHNCSVVP